MLATCLAILRRHDEAEDATQEVFTRVPHGIDTILEPRRWLLQVARNVCFDTLRRNRRRPTVELDVAHHACAQDLQDTIVDRLFVGWLIEQLPTRERIALSQHVLFDRPLDVVAETLGVSYAMAGKLTSQARRRAAARAAA